MVLFLGVPFAFWVLAIFSVRGHHVGDGLEFSSNIGDGSIFAPLRDAENPITGPKTCCLQLYEFYNLVTEMGAWDGKTQSAKRWCFLFGDFTQNVIYFFGWQLFVQMMTCLIVFLTKGNNPNTIKLLDTHLQSQHTILELCWPTAILDFCRMNSYSYLMTPVSEAGPPNPICMAAIYVTDWLVFIFLRPLVNGVDLVFQSIAMTCNSLALIGITLMSDVVKETG